MGWAMRDGDWESGVKRAWPMRMEKKTKRPAMKRLSASRGPDIAHLLRNSERAGKRSRDVVRNAAHPVRNADGVRRSAKPLIAMNRDAVAAHVPNCARPRGRRRSTSAR